MNPTLYIRIDGRGARQGADDVGRSVEYITRTVTRAGSALRGLHGSLLSLVSAMGTTQIIRNVVTEYSKYEQAIKTTAAVTQASVEDLQKMKDATRAIGVTTKFSATEAADAMLVLAKAGLTAEEAIAATPAALKMAAMESMNLERSADILAGTMAQFQIPANEANRIMDVMVDASLASLSSVEELGHSLQYAGGFAHVAGVQFEEAASSLAWLAQANIRASMGGTNLRGVLAALVAPAREGERALDRLGSKLGYTFRDFDPSKVGFITALERLKQTGITPADMETIFGRLHVSGAAVMIEQVQEIKTLYEQLKNSQGRSDQVFGGMTDTIIGSWDRVRSILKEIDIMIGEGTFGAGLKEFISGIEDGLLVLVGFERYVNGNKEEAYEWANSIRAVATAVIFLGGTLAIIGAMSVLISALASPIAAAVLALGVLASAIAYNWDEMITFGDTTATVGDYVVATWQVVSQRFMDGWDAVKEHLSEVWDDLKLSGEDWINSALDNLNLFMAAVQAAMSTLASRLAGLSSNIHTLPQVMAVATANLTTAEMLSGVGTFKVGQAALKHLASSPTNQSIQDEFFTKLVALDRAPFTAAHLRMIGGYGLDNLVGWGKGVLADTGVGQEWAGIGQEVLAAAKNRKDLRDAAPERPGFPQLPEWMAPPTGVRAPAINDTQDADDTRARESARRRFAEMLEDTQKEREWLFLSNNEREVRVKMLDAERIAEQAGLEGKKEQLKILEHELRLLQQAKQLKEIAQGVGDAFGNAFTEMVIGAQSAKEAISNLAMAVQRLVIQQAAAQPIADAISGGLGSFMTSMWSGGAGTKIPNAPIAGPVTVKAPAHAPQAAQAAQAGAGHSTNYYMTFSMPNVQKPDDFKRSRSMLQTQIRSATGGG